MGLNLKKMKKAMKLESLQRDYFQRLLSDQSVEDKMQFFAHAKRIFSMVKKDVKKKRGNKFAEK